VLEAGLLALPVALAVALAAAIFLLARRTREVVAVARDADHGRRTIADLAARADSALGRAIAPIDQVRRGLVEPQAVGEDLDGIDDEIRELAEEAQQATVPAALVASLAVIQEELARADRALAMAEHGRSILTSARVRGRELEAGTSVKRGYLNLLHAREAIADAAARAAAWRSPEESRRR
jgi:hypothetical protein